MNQYTVYRAGRGEGKTTWIINQIAGLLNTDDWSLDIALVVPAWNFTQEYLSRYVPVAVYTEQTYHNARGRRYDMVFVDNADLFYENPLDICDEVAPGKPAFLTYTPFEGSSLPKPAPKPVPNPEHLRELEDRMMIIYMLNYIYRTAEFSPGGLDH